MTQRVESPAGSLAALLASSPDHPYSHVAADGIAASLNWFAERAAAMGYAGSIDGNMLLPSALGVPRPSAMAPSTMSGGDLRAGGRFVFVGIRGFKDFHPALIAENITQADLPTPVAARAIVLEPPSGRRGDLSGRVIAGQFDDGTLSDWFVAALRDRIDADESIGVPAVLGLRSADETWSDLEKRLERKVFEIATLPPSIPGIRLYNIMAAELRVGRRTHRARRQGRRCARE